MIRIFLLLLLSFLMIGSGGGVHSESGLPDCPVCKNSGIVKSKLPPELTGLPFKSSVAIEYPSGCFGLGWLPCPAKNCPHSAAAKKEFERLVEEIRSWLECRRKLIDDKITHMTPDLKNYRPFHAETAHFYISGTFKPRKIKVTTLGRTKTISLTAEESFHLYCTRVEEVVAHTDLLFKLATPYRAQNGLLTQLYVAANAREGKAAALALAGFVDSPEGSLDAELWCGYDDSDDVMLHHKVVNAVTSILLEDYYKIVLSEDFPIWLKEAACWWVEYRIFGDVRVFREGETELPKDFPASKLEEAIWKDLKRPKSRIPHLREAMDTNLVRLNGWSRLKLWSFVDWMVVSFGKDSFEKLTKDFKDNYATNRDPSAAVKRVFDMTVDQLDDKWKAWALEHYKQ